MTESVRPIGNRFCVRDARAKPRKKEYADSKQPAEFIDIGEGDQSLLNKSHDNKLSPNFEQVP